MHRAHYRKSQAFNFIAFISPSTHSSDLSCLNEPCIFAPYFRVIIVIKAYIPDEIILFRVYHLHLLEKCIRVSDMLVLMSLIIVCV